MAKSSDTAVSSNVTRGSSALSTLVRSGSEYSIRCLVAGASGNIAASRVGAGRDAAKRAEISNIR
jgi:hypothetical protein